MIDLETKDLRRVGILNVNRNTYRTLYEINSGKYIGGASFLMEVCRQYGDTVVIKQIPIKIENNDNFRVMVETNDIKGWSNLYQYEDIILFSDNSITEGVNTETQKVYRLYKYKFLIRRLQSDPNTIRIYSLNLGHPTVDIHVNGHYYDTFYKDKAGITIKPGYSNTHIFDLDSIKLVLETYAK